MFSMLFFNWLLISILISDWSILMILISDWPGLGVVKRSVFNSVERWKQCLSVWSRFHDNNHLSSLLTFLIHSDQCLVLEVSVHNFIIIMFIHMYFLL